MRPKVSLVHFEEQQETLNPRLDSGAVAGFLVHPIPVTDSGYGCDLEPLCQAQPPVDVLTRPEPLIEPGGHLSDERDLTEVGNQIIEYHIRDVTVQDSGAAGSPTNGYGSSFEDSERVGQSIRQVGVVVIKKGHVPSLSCVQSNVSSRGRSTAFVATDDPDPRVRRELNGHRATVINDYALKVSEGLFEHGRDSFR
jgi:hypothetical protein